ncbi:GMC family oxidoreductase [Bradyrhizobium erythrophlei]|uniref:GMC family oxidoreductase n=1 Tax=Bradyrhizobium erythrophlei TaxID=1437360 RepID=UPI0035E776DA
MANDDIDVVIVGSGFAGALIAIELAKRGKRIVILEAGAKVPSDINGYMGRFYKASAKVPESPYTPTMFDANGQFSEALNDPAKVPAGRPTVMTLGAATWAKPEKAYFVQNEKREDSQPNTPFGSTYERVAGGTGHWLGTSLRFVPNDFMMKTLYGASEPDFVDWPIGYDDLVDWYGKAEAELGVSADVEDQKYLGIYFSDNYPRYPMPRIPESLTDRAIRQALKNLSPSDTQFLGMQTPPTEIPVRGTPAARNSQPYRNRRACAGNTNCIPICPIQAKYDPTITLNEALNHHNVTMMSHTVASEIVVDGTGRISEVKFIRYGIDTDIRQGTLQNLRRTEGSIKAKIFVIACNAIETARLLLMSRNDALPNKTVANRSGMVGRCLMDHPYYVAWGIAKDPVFPYRGPLITSGIEDLRDGPFRDKRGAFRVDLGNEGWNFVVAGGAVGGDPNITAIDFINGVNRSGLNADGNTGKGLFGQSLITTLNSTFSRQFRIGFLIEQTPDPHNRVTLAKETDGLGLPRPKIAYNISPYAKRGIVAAKQLQDLLFKRMGATEKRFDFTEVADDDPTRFDAEIGGKLVKLNYMGAGHLMGTYRMGSDPNQSVVDSFQRSHDHDNLYLVGSGTFPSGATANPTLTLAALALRTAERIGKRI